MPLKIYHEDQPAMNLTSMTDIIFLLTIFFLVGTKFAEAERKIGLRIPEVRNHAALTAAPEKRVVNVYKDGTITLDRAPVTLAQLTQKLAAVRAQYPDLGVLVRGDAKGEFQRVAEVLNACKQAGIGELAISVRVVSAEK